jgi:hypothetical protein
MRNEGTLTIAIIKGRELQDTTSTEARFGVASLSGYLVSKGSKVY